MPVINKSALVPYTAQEMYRLVDDINAYPDFLPWCGDAKVLERDEDEVKASILLSRSGLKKSFTTLNRLQSGKMIEMRLVEGPFSHLQGFWRFERLSDDASKIMFDIEFEFSSKLLAMTVGPVFSQITNTIVDAFTKRAIEIYGKR